MTYLNALLYTLVGYAGLVLLAETLIWRIQPTMDGGVTLTIKPDAPDQIQRNLYGFEHRGTLIVSSNHWFRSWYHAALANPDVQVMRDGVTGSFTAEPVQCEEHETLAKAYSMGFVLRLLCGFAPSRFLRLESQA